jgi:rubrerythrin
VTEGVLQLLAESRRREKAQTLFYRALAVLAEGGGEDSPVERLNALLADEQHHLARLTARVLELGGTPVEPPALPSPATRLEEWEEEARERETGEVLWYEEFLNRELDPETRKLIGDILESEGHHARELGGKWMSA